MSQQSNGDHPRKSQVCRPKLSKKKEKGQYVLWEKTRWWDNQKISWWKLGTYKTQEIAENVIRQRKLSFWKPKEEDSWKILPPGQKPD